MPSMDILKSISGINLPFSFPKINEGLCRKFAFNQSTGLVALRTENYCIQFYSLFDDHKISEVQVCERNHQPGDEVIVAVTSVALSQDGSMMCTTKVKLAEDVIGALLCLKFWASDSLNKQYSLSTIIYEPHKDAKISAVAFHPSCQMAVTASYEKNYNFILMFMIWVSSDEIQQKREMLQNAGWMCHSVGYYKYGPSSFCFGVLWSPFDDIVPRQPAKLSLACIYSTCSTDCCDLFLVIIILRRCNYNMIAFLKWNFKENKRFLLHNYSLYNKSGSIFYKSLLRKPRLLSTLKPFIGWSKLGFIFKYKHPSLLAIKCHNIPRPQRGRLKPKKRRGKERKRRERERKPRLCLVSFELPRRTPRRTKGVLQFFKVIP
ncbi:hypothetical protein UlMin_000230 [Ulmus minor]